MGRVKETVNWLAALGLIGFYAHAASVSLDPTKSMDPWIIVGLFAFVFLLMYGADKTTGLVNSIPDDLTPAAFGAYGNGGGDGGGDSETTRRESGSSSEARDRDDR